MKIYKNARAAEDYNTAVFALTAIVSKDSANNTWAYDSLAFYHYFYLTTPQTLPNLVAVEYYASRGLELNRNNHFLLELQAKAQVLQQKKDTQAYAIFENLWQATHDYTYLYYMASIDIGKGRTKRFDSLINAGINSPDSITGIVRIEQSQIRVQEKVPLKAAFLFMKSQLILQQNKSLPVLVNEARPYIKEALRIYPNFISMHQLIQQIEQQMGGR